MFFPDARGGIHVSVFFFSSLQSPPADDDAVLRVIGRVNQEVICEGSSLSLPSGSDREDTIIC